MKLKTISLLILITCYYTYPLNDKIENTLPKPERNKIDLSLGLSLPFVLQFALTFAPTEHFYLESKTNTALILGYTSLSAGYQFKVKNGLVRLDTGPAVGYWVIVSSISEGYYMWDFSAKLIHPTKNRNLKWYSGGDLLLLHRPEKNQNKSFTFAVPNLYIGLLWKIL